MLISYFSPTQFHFTSCSIFTTFPFRSFLQFYKEINFHFQFSSIFSELLYGNFCTVKVFVAPTQSLSSLETSLKLSQNLDFLLFLPLLHIHFHYFLWNENCADIRTKNNPKTFTKLESHSPRPPTSQTSPSIHRQSTEHSTWKFTICHNNSTFC